VHASIKDKDNYTKGSFIEDFPEYNTKLLLRDLNGKESKKGNFKPKFGNESLN
jgi:hypothetical protein